MLLLHDIPCWAKLNRLSLFIAKLLLELQQQIFQGRTSVEFYTKYHSNIWALLSTEAAKKHSIFTWCR